MKVFKQFLSKTNVGAVARMVVRIFTLLVTAGIVKASPETVALVQGILEAILTAGVAKVAEPDPSV